MMLLEEFERELHDTFVVGSTSFVQTALIRHIHYTVTAGETVEFGGYHDMKRIVIENEDFTITRVGELLDETIRRYTGIKFIPDNSYVSVTFLGWNEDAKS